MRSLKNLWPEFAEDVDFYAVNIDPTDDFDRLEEFKAEEGYPWPLTHSDRKAMDALDVIRQSSKLAYDSDGIIVYREKMAGGDADVWRELFEDLSSG